MSYKASYIEASLLKRAHTVHWHNHTYKFYKNVSLDNYKEDDKVLWNFRDNTICVCVNQGQ